MPSMCERHLSLVDEHPVCVRRLGKDQIPQAFPLVREAGRCDSLESWQDYATEYLSGTEDGAWPSGIVVAEQSNRCIVGLFAFVVHPCLRSGRVLSVSELTVMVPFGREEIAARLLGAVADIAARHRVRASEIELGRGAAWCAAMLGKQGYTLDDRRQIVWRRVDGLVAGAPRADSGGGFVAQP
jgi:hypothetical protein